MMVCSCSPPYCKAGFRKTFALEGSAGALGDPADARVDGVCRRLLLVFDDGMLSDFEGQDGGCERSVRTACFAFHVGCRKCPDTKPRGQGLLVG